MTDKTTLYKITASDAIQTWTIGKMGGSIIKIQYGQLNGAIQTQLETVSTNNSGRTLQQQIDLRIESRISKQLDKGYRTTIEEAKTTVGLNSSDMLKPMLAKKFKDVTNICYDDAYLQYKYNGHRCLITKINGKVIAYSRNGKEIPGAAHIIEALHFIDEGVTLDGELYIHGTPLQQLGSLIRKQQPGSKKLNYVIYDVVKDWPYKTRLGYLRSLHFNGAIVHVAPTEKLSAYSAAGIKHRLTEAIALGYEGLMLRQSRFGYEPGKRSQSLVKIKQVMDEEFEVVAVHASADGWGILECALSNGSTFRVSAPGTIEAKTEVLHNEHEYIGELVTVEFFEWTDDGKPFHPVAIAFRYDL